MYRADCAERQFRVWGFFEFNCHCEHSPHMKQTWREPGRLHGPKDPRFGMESKLGKGLLEPHCQDP